MRIPELTVRLQNSQVQYSPGSIPEEEEEAFNRRLRFSSDADIVRLTNARIIIIIIIILCKINKAE